MSNSLPSGKLTPGPVTSTEAGSLVTQYTTQFETVTSDNVITGTQTETIYGTQTITTDREATSGNFVTGKTPFEFRTMDRHAD